MHTVHKSCTFSTTDVTEIGTECYLLSLSNKSISKQDDVNMSQHEHNDIIKNTSNGKSTIDTSVASSQIFTDSIKLEI